MRIDVAIILKGMGFTHGVDFEAEQSKGVVFLRWLSGAARPTEAEIDAAAPAILAAIAADAADQTQWTTDRADMKNQYAAAVTRLIDIRDNTTNITAVAAIKDLAAAQLRILKYIRRL